MKNFLIVGLFVLTSLASSSLAWSSGGPGDVDSYGAVSKTCGDKVERLECQIDCYQEYGLNVYATLAEPLKGCLLSCNTYHRLFFAPAWSN